MRTHVLRSIRRAPLVLAAVATASLAWFSISGAAYAQTPPDPSLSPDASQGAPMIPDRGPAGYYVWHDDNGIHVRTHGPGDEHYFTMRLRTDGVFTDVDTVRMESRDKVAVLDGGHVLEMRVHTFDGIDGVNFRIAGGDRLHLRLEVDQQLISTDQIYLGAMQNHPATNPFTIRWRPSTTD